MKSIFPRLADFWASLLAAFWLAAAGACLAADQLHVLGGAVVSGDIVAITADGRIELSGGQEPIPLADVRRIDRQEVTEGPAAATVYLAGGGRILAGGVSIVDEVCRIAWPHGADLELPLDMVRGVRVGGPQAAPRVVETFEKALQETGEETDRLFLEAGGQPQVIRGVFDELGEKAVRFTWEDETREVPRDKVFGLVVAALGDPPSREGQALVTLADGSSFWAAVKRLDDGQLHLQPAPAAEVAVPWQDVASLAVRNDRLIFLSDLEPVEVVEQALVTFPLRYQRDRSVMGAPLTLGGQQFEKGLGVHSRSSLTYANEGFDIFAATIGIDAETKGRGDCEFIVLGDGEELYRQRMQAADGPREAQVSIAGVRRVTLLVAPGEDLDLADHADWGDARFIKQSAVGAAAGSESAEGPSP